MTDVSFKKYMIPNWDVAKTNAESSHFLGIGGIDARTLYIKQREEQIYQDNLKNGLVSKKSE